MMRAGKCPSRKLRHAWIRSIVREAGAFEMLLALFQVEQVLGSGEEIVALLGVDAFEESPALLLL